MRPTLTLDLGTATGYAIGHEGDSSVELSVREAGTFITATEKQLRAGRKLAMHRRRDLRFDRLCAFVASKLAEHPDVAQIVFEDVEFCSSQAQGQLWATLRSAVWCCGNPRPIDFYCVPVGTLKKAFTGRGNALKEDMASSLVVLPEFFGRYFLRGGAVFDTSGNQFDDDAVDALALLYYTFNVSKNILQWPHLKTT